MGAAKYVCVRAEGSGHTDLSFRVKSQEGWIWVYGSGQEGDVPSHNQFRVANLP